MSRAGRTVEVELPQLMDGMGLLDPFHDPLSFLQMR